MIFTRTKIILIGPRHKRQVSYVFASDLEIYIFMVSTLAFVLSYDFVLKRFRLVIFPWSKNMLFIEKGS